MTDLLTDLYTQTVFKPGTTTLRQQGNALAKIVHERGPQLKRTAKVLFAAARGNYAGAFLGLTDFPSKRRTFRRKTQRPFPRRQTRRPRRFQSFRRNTFTRRFRRRKRWVPYYIWIRTQRNRALRRRR